MTTSIIYAESFTSKWNNIHLVACEFKKQVKYTSKIFFYSVFLWNEQAL